MEAIHYFMLLIFISIIGRTRYLFVKMRRYHQEQLLINLIDNIHSLLINKNLDVNYHSTYFSIRFDKVRIGEITKQLKDHVAYTLDLNNKYEFIIVDSTIDEISIGIRHKNSEFSYFKSIKRDLLL